MAVMGLKRGTTDFATAKQTSSVRSDNSNSLSVSDTQKALGDQSVGDVLNKVADPNYVDPSKKVRAVGNNQLDKDAFLKLMLAQMKHQDPSNPMQSHEMAAQLAQFTSLEQLNNIHTTLESIKNAQAPNTNYQALSFIGKRISSDSSKVMRAAGDTEHSLNFQLLGAATDVKITVKDAAGNAIRKLDMGAMKKGENAVKWNGLNDDGLSARPGEYHVAIEAKGANGQKIYAKTQLEGRITGLNYTAQGPVLMVGDQSVRMSEVKKIEEDPTDGGGRGPLVPLGVPVGASPGAPGAAPGVATGAAAGSATNEAFQKTKPGITATQMAALNQMIQHAKSQGAVPTVMKPETKPGKQKAGAAAGATASAPSAPSGPSVAPAATSAPSVAATQMGSKSETSHQDSKTSLPHETLSKDAANVAPAEEPTEEESNLDSVPMASGLMNQLAKLK
jgi:flagellar basal-body rod modification protein FlgD